MHPTNPKPAATLWEELRALLAYELSCGGQISFINRLDRETSGIVLIAKNRTAARELTEAMKAGRFEKTYHAIVVGWPAWDELEVSEPLLRAGEVRPSLIHLKQTVHPSGAQAVTRFRVVQRTDAGSDYAGKVTLVTAKPVTGRTHQIRVHLAHAGHPILGDKIYGPSELCYLDFIERGWTEDLRRTLFLPSHALHASSLILDGRHWHCDLPSLFHLKNEQALVFLHP